MFTSSINLISATSVYETGNECRETVYKTEKTFAKPKMSLEGLSQWERDFYLPLFTPPLPHPLTLLHIHSPFQPLSQGTSHCHGWNHGVEDQQENERGPETKWGGTSQETLPPQHTAVSGRHTHAHTHTHTHHTLTCTDYYTVCKQFLIAYSMQKWRGKAGPFYHVNDALNWTMVRPGNKANTHLTHTHLKPTHQEKKRVQLPYGFCTRYLDRMT